MRKLLYLSKAQLLYIILACCCCFSACKNNKNAEPVNEISDSLKTDKKPESDRENKILDILSKLPEWEKANNYIDSLTKHKHGLSVTTEKPSKDKPDYYIRAGYNGEERFETYFHFYVNPQTFEIKIMDLVDGDIVPLNVWRKRELKRNK